MLKSVVVLPLLSLLVCGASLSEPPKPRSPKFFKGQPVSGKSPTDSAPSTNSSAPFDSIAVDHTDPPERHQIENRPIESQPTKSHPIEDRLIAGRPTAGQPIESRPIESQSTKSHPIEARSIETQPTKSHPIDARSIESQLNRDGEPDASAEGELVQNVIQTASARSGIKRSILQEQSDRTIDSEEDEQMEPEEDPSIYGPGFNFEEVPDIPALPQIDSDGSDEQFVANISTSVCEVDKCKSANQTDPNYHLVDCSSVNLAYDCFYCPKDHVLIKQKHTCIGPCENDQDCQNLLDYYKHVECPLQYVEVESNQHLCVKEDTVRDERPLSVSFFKPKHWNLKQPVDAASQMADDSRVNDSRVNETTTNPPETSDRVTNTVRSNRTLVHQIRLDDFNRDACEFEMRIESINDQALFRDDPQPGYFTMEGTMSDGRLSEMNVYLNGEPNFESALVSISCAYKSVVLHRSELYFSQDNI